MAVHPTALVAPGARLGAGVSIGPYAFIEDGAVVGDNTEIRAHAVVKRFTTIGQGNQIHEGAILGGEPQDLGWKGGDSRLVIGDGNKIREHVTIHRASKEGGVTTVGNECFLMANVHIAHDCTIGDQAILANNTALAGHVEIGPRAFVSGGVLVHQFSRIGRLAMIGGHSSVRMDCLPFVTSDGDPARAVSLNLVGLRRAGLNASQLRTLKEAYRLLLRRGLMLEDALQKMAALQDPLADELVAFVRSSKRGFGHAARDSEE